MRSNNQLQLFREEIDECSFMDLGFTGTKYTWSRHFENGAPIWERLDRGLANNGWFLQFLGTQVQHISCITSNHMPLFFNLFRLEIPVRRRLFRFEEMWLFDSKCGEIVEAAWINTEGANLKKKILK